MHEVNTQFQLINLFDDMLIEKTSNRNINVKTNSSLSIDGKKNIVFNDLVKMNTPKLSGTGSTIFYEYSDNDDIKKTLKKIPTKWRHSFCEPLQCSPLLTYLT